MPSHKVGRRWKFKASKVDAWVQSGKAADVPVCHDARPGRFIQLSVADTGTGMTEEVLRQIFEPFYTTKTERGGTGLGLATVYGIIRQHEGWIHVYSEPGAGSVFHVYLPACPEKAGPLKDAPIEESMKGRGERILIVEDNDDVRNLMARMLSQGGYNVVLAADAEEGLRLYRRAEGRFDIVCTDVVLPGRSGFDLVEDLKKENPALNVLMVSGYTDDRTRWPQIREKGWRYLQKPVRMGVLLGVLREMLDPPAV